MPLNGLTVDDFYNSDATETNVTDSVVFSNLPIQISNLIGIQEPNTVTKILVFCGL